MILIVYSAGRRRQGGFVIEKTEGLFLARFPPIHSDFSIVFDEMGEEKSNGIHFHFQFKDAEQIDNELKKVLDCSDKNSSCLLSYISIISLDIKKLMEMRRPDLTLYDLEIVFIANSNNNKITPRFSLNEFKYNKFEAFLYDIKKIVERKGKRRRRLK
jgi:hypothetical protein